LDDLRFDWFNWNVTNREHAAKVCTNGYDSKKNLALISYTLAHSSGHVKILKGSANLGLAPLPAGL
jgi:hypothetical protein